MLNRLNLENFKAWREADLTFGKVTGFFGANSAGKSSLLHLLLLLKQTRNATDRGIVLDFGGPAHMVNLGTFEDIVHQHDKTKAISWLLDWTLAETLTIADPLQPSPVPLLEGRGLEIRYAVGLHNKRPWPRELTYRFADAEFRTRPKARPRQEFRLETDHQYQPGRVRRVAVKPCADTDRGFEELPANTFDRSDRKFLAVAVVASAVVLNATDSDWDEHGALLRRLRVRVRQLCPQHASKSAGTVDDPGR